MNTKLILIACRLCLAVVSADKETHAETEKNDHDEVAARENDMEEEEEEDSPLRELDTDEDQDDEQELMDRLHESKAIVSFKWLQHGADIYA